MPEWEFSVVHHLNAALGWIELGNFGEARLELSQLPPEYLKRPEVLEIRWIIDAAREDWEGALEIAREMLNVAPDHPEGWLHQAYALRRTKDGGLESACQALEPAVEKFPNEPTIPYNLACYACRMGHLDQARALLKQAFKRGNPKAIKDLALNDSDLKELWNEIREQD